MNELVGKEVELNEGQKEWIENILSYSPALNKLFKKLYSESQELLVKERRMWREFGEIAKKQYPEFDPELHILTWNWNLQKMTIMTQEQRKKGLLG